MNWTRTAVGIVMVVALAAVPATAHWLPGDPEYLPLDVYIEPLRASPSHPGPCDAESLADCIACCRGRASPECFDWVQAVYAGLDGRPRFDGNGKLRGVWLPTIDAVRAAALRIPQLKALRINAVSFGPDIVTRDVDTPRTVGDRLIRFYVRLFHASGFFVYLVPNAMHWGNNDVSLHALTPLVLDWAEEAEELGVELYGVLNEVDGMRQSVDAASIWLQETLPLVRDRYNGIVCVQPTQAGFKSGRLNVSGYDAVSPLFSLMVPDPVRNAREIAAFLAEAERIKSQFAGIRYVMLSDVATFSGGNWAETFLMESQARAVAEGRREYVNDVEQAAAFERFLADAYPKIDGSFFNLWVGFDFLDRPTEAVVLEHFASEASLSEDPFDGLWSIPGLLEVVEGAMLTDVERSMIFDSGTYVAGWAGLCHEPSAERPGPFNCTSTTACMEQFRREPETYWHFAAEACGNAD